MDKIKEIWNGIKSWWEANAAKYFTLDYWKNLGKDIIDGFLGLGRPSKLVQRRMGQTFWEPESLC